MIKKYDMHDCTVYMESDFNELHNLFQQALDMKNDLDRRSKFHIGEEVRMTDDYYAIVRQLNIAYDYTTACTIAYSLKGRVVTVSDIDELLDDRGIKGIYYTIEDDHSMIYAFPEHIINKI